MIIYSCKKYGIEYKEDKSTRELIMEYPETEQIHRTTDWDKKTVILGERTSGWRGYITYEFHISKDILTKADYAKLFIDKFYFSGKQKYAVGRIKIGKSTICFEQTTDSGKPEWHLFGGFVAKNTYQKDGELPLKFIEEDSYLRVPPELLSEKLEVRVMVEDMQEIVINSIELQIFDGK